MGKGSGLKKKQPSSAVKSQVTFPTGSAVKSHLSH